MGSNKRRLIIRDVADWHVPEDKETEDNAKKATGCDSAVFFDDDRYNKYVRLTDEDLVGSPALTNGRRTLAGRCSFADVVVPIEVKVDHNRSAFEFKKADRLTREHADGGREALGQLGHYIASVFGRQHRTHVLSLYVWRDKARMVFTDRDVCFVSTPFKYFGPGSPNTMHRFFWRLAGLTREQLGFDPTITPASKQDFKAMYEFATTSTTITPYVREQLYYALCVDPPTSDSSGSPSIHCHQWPLQRIMRPDGLYDLVGRPKYASPALFGRCTRGFVGFDPVNRETFFVKDSWRVDHPEVHPEHLVYERLQENGVQNVPTCIRGGDVGAGTHGVQRTLTTVEPPLSEEGSGDSSASDGSESSDDDAAGSGAPRYRTLIRFARIHYRIFIKEILRPLTDFEDFQELVGLLADALIGEFPCGQHEVNSSD